MDSFFAGVMKPQVLMRMMSAASLSVAGMKPAAMNWPLSFSESTRFLEHPREMMK